MTRIALSTTRPLLSTGRRLVTVHLNIPDAQSAPGELFAAVIFGSYQDLVHSRGEARVAGDQSAIGALDAVGHLLTARFPVNRPGVITVHVGDELETPDGVYRIVDEALGQPPYLVRTS